MLPCDTALDRKGWEPALGGQATNQPGPEQGVHRLSGCRHCRWQHYFVQKLVAARMAARTAGRGLVMSACVGGCQRRLALAAHVGTLPSDTAEKGIYILLNYQGWASLPGSLQ